MLARPSRPAWLPPLPLAVALAVLGERVAVTAVWLAGQFTGGSAGLDFGYNVAAARLGLQHGWAALYDRELYGAVTRNGGPLSYDNTPAVAWLAVPFTQLPFRPGLALYVAPLLAFALTAWWLAAPGGGWQRAAHLVAMLSAAPIVFGIYLGQYSLAVMGLLAVHWWLVVRDRPVLAGVALGLACLKPQDAFLVPVALALTGRWRCLAAWAATVAGLVGLMALALGPAGVAGYGDQLLHASLDRITTTYTLWRHLPGWVPALPLRAVVAVLALVPALFEGRARYGRAMGAAVIGSLLATPYLNWQDLGQLVLAGWLVLGSPLPGWARWALAASYVAVAYPAGPIPPLVAAAVWLVLLAALAVRPPAVRGGVVPAPV